LKRGYSVGVLLSDLAAIQQFESTGKVVTKQVADKMEKQVDKIQGTGTRRKLGDILADEPDQLKITGGEK